MKLDNTMRYATILNTEPITQRDNSSQNTARYLTILDDKNLSSALQHFFKGVKAVKADKYFNYSPLNTSDNVQPTVGSSIGPPFKSFIQPEYPSDVLILNHDLPYTFSIVSHSPG